MNLEKMTYLNKDGLRVTDSLVVAKEFGVKEHNKLVRTIKKAIATRRTTYKNIIGVRSPQDADAHIEELFLTSKYLANDNNYYVKYEITEKGFYTLISKIKAGSRVGAEKLDIVHGCFIESFFMLREMVELQRKEYETAINHMQTIITNFIPIDEFTHISSVTDSPRVFAVHGYFTSKPNHRPVDKALLDAIDFCVKLPQIREALGKEILRHEANKIKEEDNPTPSTAFEHFVKKGFFDNISETVYNAYESFINGWK
jgi:phage regulator Rha-like protein